MRFLKAIAVAIQRLATTAINAPFDFLAGLLGLGGPRMPDVPPVFEAPGDTSALVNELSRALQKPPAVRNLDSEAVTSVFKLRNALDRSTVNMETITRDDVRDMLIAMPQAKLEDLCAAGRPAILKLIKEGDSGVFGVPITMGARLKALRDEMAKPKGSKPFAMPTMPAM